MRFTPAHNPSAGGKQDSFASPREEGDVPSIFGRIAENEIRDDESDHEEDQGESKNSDQRFGHQCLSQRSWGEQFPELSESPHAVNRSCPRFCSLPAALLTPAIRWKRLSLLCFGRLPFGSVEHLLADSHPPTRPSWCLDFSVHDLQGWGEDILRPIIGLDAELDVTTGIGDR